MVPSILPNITRIPPVDPKSSFYDDLTYLHMDLNPKIHWTGHFFTWHRYYLNFFEDALVEKCGYSGATPYWDWSSDAPDMYNSPFFDDSPSGVGGWGDPKNDYQINTGGFKDLIVAYPTPHRIRRNYTLYPFRNPGAGRLFPNDPLAPPPPTDLMINASMTKRNYEYTVNNFTGNFIGFHSYTESLAGVHSGAHFILGGDMTGTCPNGAIPPDCYGGPKWTPNDPVFFMHHAFIDKLWYDWQNKHPKNKWAYGGGSVQPLATFATFVQFPTGLPPYLNFDSEIPGDGLWNATIWDVMDTTGGPLCYIYE